MLGRRPAVSAAGKMSRKRRIRKLLVKAFPDSSVSYATNIWMG
jgi:hypothetical protein